MADGEAEHGLTPVTVTPTRRPPEAPRRDPPDKGMIAFWVVFIAFAVVNLVHRGRIAFARDVSQITDLSLDLTVSDFESFYRAALRMAEGLDMYFPDWARTEMPAKKGPFFELLLQPLLPLGPAMAEMVFGALSFAVLGLTLVVARPVLQRIEPATRSRWLPVAAFAMLVPFVHLATRYTQLAPLLVFLFFAGLYLLTTGRPFLGGLVWSLSIAIQITPIVLLPLLVWKGAWRALGGMLVGLALTTGAVLVHQGVGRGIGQFHGLYAGLSQDTALHTYHERFQGVPSMIMATIAPTYEGGIESGAQDVGWNGVRNFLGSTNLIDYQDLLLALATLLILATCALACRRRSDYGDARRWLGETGLVLLAMLLISPHTWKHYFWWLSPALMLALLEWRASRRVWAIGFVAVVLLTQTLPHYATLPEVWAYTYGVFHGYGIGLVLLFAILAAHLWSSRASVD